MPFKVVYLESEILLNYMEERCSSNVPIRPKCCKTFMDALVSANVSSKRSWCRYNIEQKKQSDFINDSTKMS